jgi:hypothetical protein
VDKRIPDQVIQTLDQKFIQI